MVPAWFDPDVAAKLGYLVSGVLFILGLKGMTHPRTAVRGNLTASVAMLLAVVVALLHMDIVTPMVIVAGLVVGSLIGIGLALSVEMTSMPQLVGLFNGFGGGASAVVAGAALHEALVQRGAAELGFTMTAATVASGLGTLSVVVLYLRYSERGWSYLDVRIPGLRGLAYAVGGTLAVLGGNLAIGLVFQRLGVESATHTVVQTAEADPSILLVLIPLSYLAIAPGEELLYRNVIQKSLYDSVGKPRAVVLASVIFSLVHIPAYSAGGASLTGVATTLAAIFVLSLVLGGVYARTENMIVPAVIHGSYNVLSFYSTYATGGGGGTEALAWLF